MILIIPAIALYEVNRELHRLSAVAKLERLARLRGRYRILDISREALDQAARFWALLRNTGKPTASADALDADAILAGMAATFGLPRELVTIATTYVQHLSRFPGTDARFWETLV